MTITTSMESRAATQDLGWREIDDGKNSTTNDGESAQSILHTLCRYLQYQRHPFHSLAKLASLVLSTQLWAPLPKPTDSPQQTDPNGYLPVSGKTPSHPKFGSPVANRASLAAKGFSSETAAVGGKKLERIQCLS